MKPAGTHPGSAAAVPACCACDCAVCRLSWCPLLLHSARNRVNNTTGQPTFRSQLQPCPNLHWVPLGHMKRRFGPLVNLLPELSPCAGATACRHDSSLGLLTKKFLELIHATPDGILDLNKAAEALSVRAVRRPPSSLSLACGALSQRYYPLPLRRA